MTTISVPRSVAEALAKAKGLISVVDEYGNLLGSFSPAATAAEELSPEQIADIKRRLRGSGPWYTTEQVLAFIDAASKSQ